MELLHRGALLLGADARRRQGVSTWRPRWLVELGPVCPRARGHVVARRALRARPLAGGAGRAGGLCRAAPRLARAVAARVPGRRGRRGALRRGQRGDVRHLRRLPHLSPADARGRPAHGALVGGAAPHAGVSRPVSSCCRSPIWPVCWRRIASGRSRAPVHLGRLAVSAALLAAWVGGGPVRLRARVDDAPGPPHRRERALGAGVVDRARGDARRHGAVVGRLRRRRSRRLCAAGAARPRRVARAVRLVGARPACASRARPSGAPPNVILVVLEAVAARWTSLGNARYDTTPTLTAEAGARARVRQLLRAHRAQLQFAGGDAALHLSEARFPGRHRAVPGAWRHVAGVGVSRARLPHVVRHAERPAAGPGGTRSSSARGFDERARLSRPDLRRAGVVVGRRGPLHGGRHDRTASSRSAAGRSS